MSGPDAERGLGDGAPVSLHLFALARALGEAFTPDQAASAVFEHVMRSFGASTVGLWLVGEEDVIRFAGGAGHSEPQGPESIGAIAMDSDLPAAVAIRSDTIAGYGSIAERDQRWPQLAGLQTVSEAVAVVPLTARGRPLGALHIGWPVASERLVPEHDLLRAVADLCATALDRSLLYESELTARQTLEFLNQGTRLMVTALDPEEIVRSLVELAVPRLAPWCTVYVAEGDHLNRVAIEMAPDPRLAGELRHAAPIPLDADVPLAEVFRTGLPAVVQSAPADVLKRTYPPEQARRVAAVAGREWAALVLPVQAEGEVIGVMSLVSPSWGDRIPSEVHLAAESLAARAGIALRNARRYHEQVENVSTLTAALLPPGVPEIPGLRLAARYTPASGGVCGDWYEAELMPDGQVLVGIGDASGHGLVAAATMARVRHAARGLAVAGIRPARMLEHLSRLLSPGPTDEIATVVYGLIDPATGASTWSNAGHPPPFLLAEDGTVSCVPLEPGPPIGAGEVSHVERDLTLPAGSRLVLYTDGLFERRGEDPMVGISRLRDTVCTLAGATEDHIAEAMMASRGGSDDACVLVIGR